MLNYEDIISMPHHVSNKRKPMSMENRATQFAPFSALTGYSEKIKETSRLTKPKIEIDEELKSILNTKIQIIKNNIKSKPLITITYFVPDKQKRGGLYKTITTNIKKIDETFKKLILINGNVVVIDNIINITGDLFKDE